MTHHLLKQLKKRRLELGLKQKDMLLRVGVSKQQYQFLESKGNPRLNTLALVAAGLNSELMLIPKENLMDVKALLEHKSSLASQQREKPSEKEKKIVDDPWENLLEDDS